MTTSIIGAGESPYTRHPAGHVTTSAVLTEAIVRALEDAGVRPSAVDGFGVSSFTLAPDHAIDLAWRLGLRLHWLMEDTNGGASAGAMLQHAVRAVEAGDATTVVLVAGDRMDATAFSTLVARYNRATADHLTPLPVAGPNPQFALLTQRQMAEHGLTAQDYGRLVLSQRCRAARNTGAVYRSTMTMSDYLDAPVVASPLRRFDCVPPVTGADAVVVSADHDGTRRARVRAVAARYNGDDQLGDGLTTGLADLAHGLWETAGLSPRDVDVVSVYDDYPAMSVAQLLDVGLLDVHDVPGSLHRLLDAGKPAVNTSDGQLSAGQAGSAGGMHGLVEVVQQLRGRAGDRQVTGARFGLVTGYGMVLYRYGGCANAVVLEGAS